MLLRSHHVTLLSSGEATYCINGETIQLRRGTLLFTSPGCEQTYWSESEDRPTVITARFDPEADHPLQPSPVVPEGGEMLAVNPWKETSFLDSMEQLHRHWIRRADPVAEKACSWLLQSLLLSMLDEQASPETGSFDVQMEEVRLMLDSDPEGNLAIADLAKACGISSAHFSRRFKRHAGVPAKEYQLQSRMRFARNILQNSGASVKEVANRLGYSDPFVFSRQFKKVWGVSPSKV